jgi:hypothetical protein
MKKIPRDLSAADFIKLPDKKYGYTRQGKAVAT